MAVFYFLSSSIVKSQCNNLALFATNDPVNCITSSTSATVNVLNGTPPFTYTWLPTGGNGSVAVNLAPNSYTIYARDAVGCTGSTQLIILNNSAVPIIFSTLNLNCFGQNNGQISANAARALPPLSYSWTPAAPNSAVITNLSVGNYTLTVTDGSGCTHTGTTTVFEPPAITTTITAGSLTCAGGQVSASVTASGGVSPYTYSWLPTASTGTVVNNIPAGIYTVVVTDNNGCVKNSTVNIASPAPITATLGITNVTCNSFSNGAVSCTVSGGTPAYSYTWAPININASSVGGLAAGNYSLFVKDVKGCSLTQTFSITQPAAITTTFNHTDEFCVNADGTATVNVSGGNGSYTYSWSTTPVQTSSVATNLAAGNYSVQISDIKNCKGQGVITIGNVSNMLAQISNKKDVTCNASCNGSATVSISGGSGPYTYNWLSIPNATNQSVSNLCPGTFTVKVTDALGCYTTTAVSITEPPAMTYSVSGNNLICSGNSTSLSSTVTGGSPNYSYNWQPGNLSGFSITVSPTVTTGYSLTVTDSKGCVGAVKVYSVTVNPPLSISSGGNNLTVCPNVNTSITVNANGGDGNYTYLWQPGNLSSNNITVNLQSTTIYTVTISDGCGTSPVSTTVSVTVYTTSVPVFTVNSITGCEPFCVQFNNLTTGTTTALWTFGDFSAPVQGQAASHCYNKAGNYNVMLTTTDIHGCKASTVKQNYIKVYGKPVADFIQKPEMITLTDNKGVFENASVNASNFSWSLDGLYLSSEQNLQHQFFETGCFMLKLIASNGNSCRDTTEREICVTEGFNFWAPNAFSPDEDGINDLFIPKGTGWSGVGYNFEITSRWGMTVFRTGDINTGWDGKIGGVPATDDIYNWKVFINDIYGKEHEFTGHVLIMR